MFATLRTLWLALSGKTQRKSRPHRRPVCHRPRLEVLEERAVPASLSYSTYLNGAISATAVDSAGNVYVAGSGFVAKLNPTGSNVIYNYNLGGYGIAVDAAGDAYVIGDGSGVPTTANAISSTGTIYVAELNPSGTGLVYSTYLPGAVGVNRTLGYTGAIAVDGSGNIYVTGATQAGFPVTAGAFQSAYLGSSSTSNAFFAKINPALSGSASVLYATYLGGNGLNGDAGYGIALDTAGNAYLTGYTSSTNFPTTPGAFQSTYIGNIGATESFVAKINPTLIGAASLVYSTYLGGSGAGVTGATGYVSSAPGPVPVQDNPQTDGGIAVDSAGNAYVTSATTSSNFPTTPGAFQTKSGLSTGKSAIPPPSDVFVTKLNATGTALVYSTYLAGGGKTRSGGAAIAVDASGDAHVTGWTNSTAFPTKNPLQAANGGGFDAFVTVLNPSGSGLLFSTYFGGSSDDYGYGIALDSSGNAYVGGQTSSTNFPTTAGAYQTTPGSGFAFEIDPPAGGAEAAVHKQQVEKPVAGAATHPAGGSVLRREDLDVLFDLLPDTLRLHKGRQT